MKNIFLVKVVRKAIQNLHAKFKTYWCKIVQVMGFFFRLAQTLPSKDQPPSVKIHKDFVA